MTYRKGSIIRLKRAMMLTVYRRNFVEVHMFLPNRPLLILRKMRGDSIEKDFGTYEVLYDSKVFRVSGSDLSWAETENLSTQY